MSVEGTAAEPVAATTTETPAPGATPDPAATAAATAEAAAAADRDDKGRFRNPVQPRIDELTRKQRESEREAAYWRVRAEAAEKKPDPEPPKPPTADQFDDYGEYVKAVAKFEAKHELKAELAERDKESAKKTEAQTRTSNWQQRSAEAAKTIPDLDAVLKASTVPLADHVTAELLDSEFGPHIAYHIDKNPAIAERLNGMNERQAAREIGRLEALFESPKPASDETETSTDAAAAETPAAPAARVTKAPPPVKPTGQGRSTSVDLAKASMDDYVAQRKAQGASWAR